MSRIDSLAHDLERARADAQAARDTEVEQRTLAAHSEAQKVAQAYAADAAQQAEAQVTAIRDGVRAQFHEQTERLLSDSEIEANRRASSLVAENSRLHTELAQAKELMTAATVASAQVSEDSRRNQRELGQRCSGLERQLEQAVAAS